MLSKLDHESWMSSKLRHTLQCSDIDVKFGWRNNKQTFMQRHQRDKIFKRSDSYPHSSVNLINWPTARIHHRTSRLVQIETEFWVTWIFKRSVTLFVLVINSLIIFIIHFFSMVPKKKLLPRSHFFLFTKEIRSFLTITSVHFRRMCVTTVQFDVINFPGTKESCIVFQVS